MYVYVYVQRRQHTLWSHFIGWRSPLSLSFVRIRYHLVVIFSHAGTAAAAATTAPTMAALHRVAEPIIVIIHIVRIRHHVVVMCRYTGTAAATADTMAALHRVAKLIIVVIHIILIRCHMFVAAVVVLAWISTTCGPPLCASWIGNRTTLITTASTTTTDRSWGTYSSDI